MKKIIAKLATTAALLAPAAAFAQEGHVVGAVSQFLPLGVALAIGIAALGGTLGQAKAISAALESIARNPSASGEIRAPMILGLVFIEPLVIFSFVIAYLLLGKI